MTQWRDRVSDINDYFPVGDGGGAFPEIANSLDEGLRDRLWEQLQTASPINALYVEDLLRDCAARVAYCLQIRDKAHELETRAINEALAYRVQSAAVTLQKTVNEAVGPHAGKLSMNATRSQTQTGGTTEFDSAINWGPVSQEQARANAAQIEVLADRKAKAETPGNGSNYRERYGFLKKLFDQSFVETYRRATRCADALKRVYGIDRPLPPFKPTNYLDDFAFWVQSASDALSTELDARFVGEIGFALNAKDASPKANELMTKADYDAAVPTRRIAFRLKAEHFDGYDMEGVLLRSVRIQMGSADGKTHLWPIRVRVPGSDLSTGIEMFSCVAPSLYQEGHSDAALIRGVHNIDPRGDWLIELPEESLDGLATTPANLPDIYLIVRVSYRRKQV